MHRLVLILPVVAAAAALAGTAGAAPPHHGTFTSHDHFVDTDTCGFPIVGDYSFTNDNVGYVDSSGQTTRVELHETTVGTQSANGITLHERDTENVHVDFVDGVPVTSKHTGALFHMVAPGGTLFLVGGQLLFEVVNGFDGPLLKATGVDFGGDVSDFCAAFA
ncbi:MAG TPA: hypothetical protein VFA66_06880 [Gaiellaceae bacterium]|nr:hypothetical protein [Gaiellaceae bacterium]